MWKKMQAVRPSGRVWQKMMLAVTMFGVAVLAFCWGRRGALPEAKAQTPGNQPVAGAQYLAPGASTDYGTRVVAFIYNNMPITRQDLGEYLIARFGTQRVEFLVNRRIIEIECARRNIFVTDAEVEAQLKEDLDKSFGQPIKREQFENQILRRFNKTMYEWKEDVIRPKIAMAKLARPRVMVTEKDLLDGFEARYGPKVECRMIAMQPGTPGHVQSELWEKLRKDPKAFDEEARKQFLPALASTGGVVPPIHKHFGDAKVEQQAFALKPGEISERIGMEDKSVIILKCVKHIEPDSSKTLQTERLALQKEIFELKLQQEIPKVFEELKKVANPQIILRDQVREEDLKRDAKQEIDQLQPGTRQ